MLMVVGWGRGADGGGVGWDGDGGGVGSGC